MTRETKVGLMMVALLVGVFGFLLYKRVHRPAEMLAGQSGPTESTIQEPAKLPSSHADDAFELFETKSKPTLRPVRDVQLARADEEEFPAKTPVRSSSIADTRAKRQKPKLSDLPDSSDNEFESPREQTTYRKNDVKHATRKLPDDWDIGMTTQRSVKQVNAAVEESSNSDPFGNASTDGFDQQDPPPLAAPQRRDRHTTLPRELNEEQESPSSSFASESNDVDFPITGSARRADHLQAEDASFSHNRRADTRTIPSNREPIVQTSDDFSATLGQPPREARRPAPFSNDGFSPESSSRRAAGANGPNYLVEPNDNFWLISKKRYGAGRYYMALAQHNLQVIPDPKRMKPGVTIATPDASVLEEKYAALIPKAAPVEYAPTTTQSRKSEDLGPPGYFVANDGAPMYRVGDHDTLTEIAKSHLGRSSRWVQILEMNRNVLRDGNELTIGTVLRLPADASRVQIVGTLRDNR